MTSTSRRYPADRLASELGVSLWTMFDQVGCSGSTAATVRDRGFSTVQADKYAARAGLSAYSVWPEMVDHLIEDTERVCAADGCEQRFMPKQQRSKFCSRTCLQRDANRRYQRRRMKDPVYRERKRAAAARYYREVTVPARQRRRSRGAA